MNHLIASLIVLVVGPVLHRLFSRRRPMLALLDGFNFVAITGVVFLSVLPEGLLHGGPWILAFCLGGLLVPTYIERHFHRAGRDSHFVALLLGMIGLCIHAIFDGAALVDTAHVHAEPHSDFRHETHLPFAIVIHRIPIGLTVWLLLRPRYGFLAATGVLALLGVNTVIGFSLGEANLEHLPVQVTAYFEALVAGSLLHVVFHRPGHDDTNGEPSSVDVYEGVGGAIGIGLLATLFTGSGLLFASELGSAIAQEFVELALASAPALLLGYTLAGLLHAFMPMASVQWTRRGGGFGQSLRGMAIGLPLPVCSCGVVPLYRTLIQRGAPPTAAMAFLIATPELGIDAVLLSIPLLGGEMTILRVVASAAVALLVGWIVGGFAVRRHASTPASSSDGGEEKPAGKRMRSVFRFGLGELVDNTAPWILLGLSIAALVQPLLETYDADALGQLPGPLKVIGFALLGVPTYVCASGATPLVAVLLASSVTPGAALAFLLTGPATNVTTFGVLGRLHGRRIALIFSVTILALSVSLGLLVNVLFPEISTPDATTGHEHSEERWFATSCLAAIGLLYFMSFVRRGPRRFLGEIIALENGDGGHEHSHQHSHQEGRTGKSGDGDCCGKG